MKKNESLPRLNTLFDEMVEWWMVVNEPEPESYQIRQHRFRVTIEKFRFHAVFPEMWEISIVMLELWVSLYPVLKYMTRFECIYFRIQISNIWISAMERRSRGKHWSKFWGKRKDIELWSNEKPLSLHCARAKKYDIPWDIPIE